MAVLGFRSPVLVINNNNNVCMHVCNTLTPQIKGMPEPIYHIIIALPTSLKNLVIGNGGGTFFVYTFIARRCTILMYCTLSISHYYMPCSFISFDISS